MGKQKKIDEHHKLVLPGQKCIKIYRDCTVKVYDNPHRIHVVDRKGKTILNLSKDKVKQT